jgi:hypothetical protein
MGENEPGYQVKPLASGRESGAGMWAVYTPDGRLFAVCPRQKDAEVIAEVLSRRPSTPARDGEA